MLLEIIFATFYLINFSFSEDTCTKYQPLSNFNLARYAGVWYQAEIFPLRNESFYKCTKLTYNLLSNNTYDAETDFLELHDGTEDKKKFIMRPQGDPTIAELLIEYQLNGTTIHIPLTILATDYINYSLTWSCMEDPYYYMTSVNLRNRPASKDILKETHKIMSKFQLDNKFQKRILMDNCSN